MAGTLVFPSTVPAARAYARDAAARGERVVGAASLPKDETAAAFPLWERLPSVHDVGFAAAVRELAARHDLTHVFAPVTVVHAALSRLIAAGAVPLTLVNPHPIAAQNAAVGDDLARAAALHPLLATLCDGADGGALPDRRTLAAMLRTAGHIYGESHEVKLAAMFALTATAPPGDLVEIGTLMGKSASALVLAAHLSGHSTVLTVDPWTHDTALQHDSPALLRDICILWDYDRLADGYYLNMRPLAGGRLNHLRLPSTEAFAVYERSPRIETPLFGATDYAGRIALLHIDANHDLAAVRKDWALWGRRLMPGGWVVFDDYTWLHGAGPRRVGDALLAGAADPAPPWDRALVCGGALFVRRAAAAEPPAP
ncbi:class I SAM-dependent methyltransferase [Roseospira goensis]|uniref:Uncharacterized protein n=1 Tax=Roseospira goensis TaxID=391922 RepID=A0A7W6WJ37_9PROT|nr:class I SAM-dependent methyltransferase [Roseospira goensis]MBB4284610.1 hypothetical protein [Roseospira goensis]